MEEFHRVLNVNTIGTFNVLRRACHLMVDNQPDANGQRGVIINTSGVAAYEGQIGMSNPSLSHDTMPRWFFIKDKWRIQQPAVRWRV